MTTPVPDGLVRTLGIRALTANTVNVIVGTGIFVLPATVAAILGSGWIIVYLICAVAIALVTLSIAEAGSRVSETGGTYRYVEAAFGSYAGVLVGVVLWLSNQAANAAVAVVFIDTVGEVAPIFQNALARGLALIVTYLGLATLNIRGVRTGVRLVEIVTAAKLAPLVLLIAAGLFAIHPGQLGAWGHAPLADIGRASLILFYAFTGIEIALAPAGEVKDPARTVPRAVLLALVIVTALYIGIHLVAQGVLGADLARDPVAPLADTAGRVFGRGGRVLMLAATALSTFAFISGDTLASPRIPFALGRGGFLPSIVGTVHPRYRTPHVAIIIYSTLACLLALTGAFPVLIVLGSIGSLLIYLACCLAAIELRRRKVRTAGAPFVLPGGPTIPVLASIVVIWLVSHATRTECITAGAALTGASALYLFRRAPMPIADPL
jgi:basic amino acid/polyamine antiporter, APA family